jgi:solute carrier family 25 (mitochondrial aspartate/glutamate transporter), member 12/13
VFPAYLFIYFPDDFNKESVKLIAGIVDMDKDGFISFPEFQAFEGLLCVPDALYKTAFQLFDTNGNGLVAFGNFYSCCPHRSNVQLGRKVAVRQ